ncbi:unnamed protein product [Lactuca virosa]|uniref:Uncharacterized protein n=1 Tax=Lactuca virosa TaxID=75947 RepID=A0AAU9MXF3_9ASTR|nr:unnamed protein product [Lactuca virosa]
MVERPSFTGYKIVETFDCYGWGGVLDFNPTQIYVDIVQEWMRTLRRIEVPGRPKELQLIGTVRTHDIVMIVQGIRDMFHVDTGYHLHDLENQPTEYRCIDTRGGGVTLGVTPPPPHVALISTYVTRELGNRIRVPRVTSYQRILHPTATSFRHISFQIINGRHTLVDSSTNLTYTAPLGVGDEEQFVGDFQGDQQQQRGQAAG